MIDGLRRELFADDCVAMKNTNNVNVDVNNLQLLIFSNIRNCLLASKPLAEAWMKNISQISVPENCK